jgi:flagellar FliJ protein
MTGVKIVRLAIQVATVRRDQAAAVLLQMQQSQSLAQEQMSQLQTYADETEARWAKAAQISVTTEMMRHHYQFMDRLQQAVILQEGVLGQWGSKVERARKHWLETEFRVTSLKQVLKSHEAELALVQARREQKEMDEFAAMQTRRTAQQTLEEDRR